MMMIVDRSGSLLAINLLLFMFLRTGRWLRLMRFSGYGCCSMESHAHWCGIKSGLFDSQSIPLLLLSLRLFPLSRRKFDKALLQVFSQCTCTNTSIRRPVTAPRFIDRKATPIQRSFPTDVGQLVDRNNPMHRANV
jgi:hypothetical protein